MKQSVSAIGLLAVALLLTATPTFAAAPTAAPEIDGNSLALGLGVLSGGVLILRARWAGRNRPR